ncbi:L-aspartate oxidase [Clostridium folliculivorans]|uniref:L-aspartate oxidase n=1 Tax=Clostridium folliculivorans TaxID=2886038 RepID=A0A9W5Y133_9CLOT|nr:L-aspartate oxidase [Clostridium folliculivorans]GKU24688.1 L-aspartate oxidase [Clostridium folliculivorans]GKU30786.1 L-aspartate oxidase [Clostridium folliculivorans]
MILNTDVLIIGAGITGLNFALNLRDDLDIIVLAKNSLQECNSYLAQGGISVLRNENDYEAYIGDTLSAGGFKNKRQAVEILVKESRAAIKRLEQLEVPFNRDKNGELIYTREGAHSINRIVHCDDNTGEQLHKVLEKKVREKTNVKLIENCFFADLLASKNRCVGALAINEGKELNIIAKTTIIATGGIGGLFKNSTNFHSISGDGIAIAIKNNIKVEHLNYIQFHPTSFYEDIEDKRRLLISEAVRGEGGRLLNKEGSRFVNELLPRDKVTEAIIKEELKYKSNHVYLDISFLEKDFVLKRFPNIYKNCLERGIDITKEPIPVTPAQHYFMGGIKVDMYCRTSMENLYAAGEVSSTGLHGANRLASNSLLESLVFSNRAVEYINRTISPYSVIFKELIKKSDGDKDYYNNSLSIILQQEIKKVRGDIINELVAL